MIVFLIVGQEILIIICEFFLCATDFYFLAKACFSSCCTIIVIPCPLFVVFKCAMILNGCVGAVYPFFHLIFFEALIIESFKYKLTQKITVLTLTCHHSILVVIYTFPSHVQTLLCFLLVILTLQIKTCESLLQSIFIYPIPFFLL